eukprot:6210663-Pleurochrysis_carterae.AAC.2
MAFKIIFDLFEWDRPIGYRIIKIIAQRLIQKAEPLRCIQPNDDWALIFQTDPLRIRSAL